MNIKNKKLYYILIVLSIILIIGSIAFFNKTKVIAPIIIVISVYLIIGSIIKLCKTNNKLKKSLLSTLEWLFWLP